jgi:flagellin
MRANFLKVSSNHPGAVTNGIQANYLQTADIEFRPDIGWYEYTLDLTSSEKASANIKVIDEAINTVSTERARLGAYENRLEHTINNLTMSSQNLSAAESRIRDVDFAKEMAEFTKNNILNQAAQASWHSLKFFSRIISFRN